MRLGKAEKTIMLGNKDLIEYCRGAGISLEKLKKCNIEEMEDTFVFVLSKENVRKSKLIIPLDIDIESQPDVVLILEVKSDSSIEVTTTDKTVRILNI